jgi:hypothetical protein
VANKNRKSSRRRRKKSNNNMTWIVAGAVGLVVLVAAALALRSGSDNGSGSGQKQFDANFEPEVSGAPRVEVVQDDVIDYGDVKLGTTVTTTYNVRNVGDEPLAILGEPVVELVEGC